MIVCAHGNVSAYCAEQNFTICETWNGDLLQYDGICRVVVTDLDVSLQEFCYLKMRMRQRGIEIYSTHHEMSREMSDFLDYIETRERNRRKQLYGGRQPFGYQRRNGEIVENPAMMRVARKIIELRDAGMKLREIQAVPEIHHPDGRRISVSTIQMIVKNRGRYEK